MNIGSNNKTVPIPLNHLKLQAEGPNPHRYVLNTPIPNNIGNINIEEEQLARTLLIVCTVYVNVSAVFIFLTGRHSLWNHHSQPEVVATVILCDLLFI